MYMYIHKNMYTYIRLCSRLCIAYIHASIYIHLHVLHFVVNIYIYLYTSTIGDMALTAPSFFDNVVRGNGEKNMYKTILLIQVH